MKKIFKKIFILSVLLLFVAPMVSADSYSAIAPISGVEYSTTDIASYINSLYNWGISIVGVLALLQLTIGGIQYMVSGAVEQKSAAKGRIADALIGLGLALTAYLFLYLINPGLVELQSPSLDKETLEKIEETEIEVEATSVTTTTATASVTACSDFSIDDSSYTCVQSASNTKNCSSGITYYCTQWTTTTTTQTPISATDLTAAATTKADLASAGISVSSSSSDTDTECTYVGQTDCTSLIGIKQSTIDGVKAIKNNCGCSVTITGGTESGHTESGTYTHSAGYKVDLRIDSGINTYIYSQIGTSSPAADTNYPGSDGNTYRLEDDHWDIVIKS